MVGVLRRRSNIEKKSALAGGLMSARPALVSDRPWLDKDGDGEITTEELNKIPLFMRAPMKTQGLLRDFHRIHGKNSILFVISKFDFV